MADAADAERHRGRWTATGRPAGLEHLPDLEEASSWIGFKLDDADGRGAGRVEGLFVDSRDGAPTWIAVKTGRLRGHSAVPFEFAAAGIGHVWVPYAKEQIRSSPEVDPTAASTTPSSRRSASTTGSPRDRGAGAHSTAVRTRRRPRSRCGEAPTRS